MRAGQVFDGERLVDLPTELVEDARVVAVGESLPETVDVVDLGSATLLPGLVDCHQHLVFDGQGTLEEQVAGRSDAELGERARRNARRASRSRTICRAVSESSVRRLRRPPRRPISAR